MPALVVYACGFGARATLLSLVTSWFDRSVRARLYSAILLVELCGTLAGEPLVQGILSLSFSLPKLWRGLPFLFCSVSTTFVLRSHQFGHVTDDARRAISLLWSHLASSGAIRQIRATNLLVRPRHPLEKNSRPEQRLTGLWFNAEGLHASTPSVPSPD